MQIWTCVIGFAAVVLSSPQVQNVSLSPPVAGPSAPADVGPPEGVPPPEPIPPAEPVPAPAAPSSTTKPKESPTASPTPVANEGPICECGYTYCASVLKAMKTPWTTKQLADAYCTTPHVSCTKGKPGSNIEEALFICLCAESDQKIGTDLDLVCGCDKCLNTAPDFRGRCEKPCL